MSELDDQSFQARVNDWVVTYFGAAAATDRPVRNFRHLEEALELVQACGCSREDAHALVDYVFDRPSGEPVQEVGGVLTTLAALCSAQGIDMNAAGETELARVWTKIDKIRANEAAKIGAGPLPGPSEPLVFAAPAPSHSPGSRCRLTVQRGFITRMMRETEWVITAVELPGGWTCMDGDAIPHCRLLDDGKAVEHYGHEVLPGERIFLDTEQYDYLLKLDTVTS